MTKFDWVTSFMKETQRNWLFYDKVDDQFQPVHFDDEVEEMVSGEKRHYKEVCFKRGNDIQPINDEYVYYQHHEAAKAVKELIERLPNCSFTIFGFRHSGDDWSLASTIEPSVWANKLGWGVFMHKASSVISHTNGGESSSGNPETPPTDDGEAEESGEDR